MKYPSFYVISGAIVAVCMVLSLLALIIPTGFWAILALGCFMAFCAALLRFRPASFILLAPMLFLRSTEFVSGIAIEYGFYINELTMYGEPTGAFARLCALYVLYFCIASSVIEPAWAKVRTLMITLPERMEKARGFRILVMVTVLMLGYILSIGFENGFPLIEGVDRFRYRLDLQNPVFVSFFGNRFILILLLGTFALAPDRRNLSVLLIVGIFVISALYSEKFTSIALMLILSLLPRGLYVLAKEGVVPTSLIIKVPLVISFITVPLVLAAYGFNENPDIALQRFMDRITNQGELWWVADRDHMEIFRLEAEPILADMRTWFVPSAQNPIEVGPQFGLYYVMQRYAPSEIAYAAALQGTGYVFSLLPYLMMTTGVAGVILVGILLHLLLGCVMGWIAQSIAKASILQLIVSTKLFVFIVPSGFVIGYLWSFFGIKTLILVGLYLSLEFILSGRKGAAVRSEETHAS